MRIISSEVILACLQNGEINLEGQFLWGSNHTLLTQVKQNELTLKAVYKPVQGERPLWDFPSDTLAGREVAAYLVSRAIGWDFVPLCVYRGDGPSGPGSLQLYIEHDPEYHYFTFSSEHRQRLRQVALFDDLVNNTDRKGGHLLIDPEDKLWLIDHGICFHAVPKLRTVIWDFAGQSISDSDCQDLKDFRKLLEPQSALVEQLAKYLTAQEIQALRNRANDLIAAGRFPSPTDSQRSYPWPPV